MSGGEYATAIQRICKYDCPLQYKLSKGPRHMVEYSMRNNGEHFTF